MTARNKVLTIMGIIIFVYQMVTCRIGNRNRTSPLHPVFNPTNVRPYKFSKKERL